MEGGREGVTGLGAGVTGGELGDRFVAVFGMAGQAGQVWVKV